MIMSSSKMQKVKNLMARRHSNSPFKLVDPSSAPCTSNFQENDDEAEKQASCLQRIHRHFEQGNKLSPMKKVERSLIKSAIADFTKEEIVEHYDFCMKLSSENKITTKNAFALHLIDYFADVVKKQDSIPNFQMASMTLHAASRIYAVRVDSLHSDALKMASGLHSKRNEQSKSDEVANDGSDAPQKPQIRTQTKKGKDRFLPDGSEKSLDGTVEIIEEPHENFIVIKSAFDGTRNSLLFECSMPCDNNRIPFSEAFTHFQDKLSFPHIPHVEIMDDSIMNDLFQVFIEKTFSILPSLGLFSFAVTKWPCAAEKELSQKTTAMDSEMMDLTEMFAGKLTFENTEELSETMIANIVEFEKVSTPCYEDLAFSPLTATPIRSRSLSGRCHRASGSRVCTRSSNKHLRSRFSLISGSAIKSFRTSVMEPPTPYKRGTVSEVIGPLFKDAIDPIIDATLTGRSKFKKPEKKKSPLKKKKKKNQLITFENTDATKLKIKKYCSIYKNKNRLSKNFMEKSWMAHNIHLPNNASFDKKNFLKKLLLLDVSPSALYLEIPSYSNFGQPQSSFGQPHSSFGPSTSGCNESLLTTDDCELYTADENRFNECMAALEKLSFLSDEDLVPKPETVSASAINFTASVSSIDERRLRNTIWAFISSYYGLSDSIPAVRRLAEQLSKMAGDQSPMPIIPLRYVILYNYLLGNVPEDVARNLHYYSAFNTLLHLANEKNLCVFNPEKSMGNPGEISLNEKDIMHSLVTIADGSPGYKPKMFYF